MSPAGPEPSGQDLIVVDAGVAVGFAATRSLPHLVNPLLEVGFEIQCPAVVDGEIADQDHKMPGVQRNWRAVVQSGRVTVLEPIGAGIGDPRVLSHVAAIRQVATENAMANPKDLGEVMTVAHALVARDDGHPVVVSVDDSYGRELSARHGLAVIGTVEVLNLGIRLGHYKNLTEVQDLYRRLGTASRLPAWKNTGLKETFRAI